MSRSLYYGNNSRADTVYNSFVNELYVPDSPFYQKLISEECFLFNDKRVDNKITSEHIWGLIEEMANRLKTICKDEILNVEMLKNMVKGADFQQRIKSMWSFLDSKNYKASIGYVSQTNSENFWLCTKKDSGSVFDEAWGFMQYQFMIKLYVYALQSCLQYSDATKTHNLDKIFSYCMLFPNAAFTVYSLRTFDRVNPDEIILSGAFSFYHDQQIQGFEEVDELQANGMDAEIMNPKYFSKIDKIYHSVFSYMFMKLCILTYLESNSGETRDMILYKSILDGQTKLMERLITVEKKLDLLLLKSPGSAVSSQLLAAMSDSEEGKKRSERRENKDKKNKD